MRKREKNKEKYVHIVKEKNKIKKAMNSTSYTVDSIGRMNKNLFCLHNQRAMIPHCDGFSSSFPFLKKNLKQEAQARAKYKWF